MKKTEEFLKENDGFLILTHKKPDGDAAGSAAALCISLRILGKTAYIFDTGEFTQRYLPFVQKYFAPKDFSAQKIIAVDVADESMLSKSERDFEGKIDLCIDHHPTNPQYAGYTLLRENASAAGEIIWELCVLLDVAPCIELANAIYVAISTDTGCFKYSNTGVFAHMAAAWCIENGADIVTLNTELFELKTEARVEVERELFSNLTYGCSKKVGASVLSRDFIEKIGATEDDLDNLSSLLMQIRGLLCGFLLTENKERGTYKISCRSRAPIDAGRLCKDFGGGGHPRAAGGNISGSAEDCIKKLLLSAEANL